MCETFLLGLKPNPDLLLAARTHRNWALASKQLESETMMKTARIIENRRDRLVDIPTVKTRHKTQS